MRPHLWGGICNAASLSRFSVAQRQRGRSWCVRSRRGSCQLSGVLSLAHRHPTANGVLRSFSGCEIAAEFVRLKVDVIFTSVTGAVIAAKQATSFTPIVFTTVTDPVVNGLVASIARPGGNVTGLSQQTSELGGKRLGLLHEIVPRLRRVAVMANITNPSTVAEMSEISAAARILGLEILPIEIRRSYDIPP